MLAAQAKACATIAVLGRVGLAGVPLNAIADRRANAATKRCYKNLLTRVRIGSKVLTDGKRVIAKPPRGGCSPFRGTGSFQRATTARKGQRNESGEGSRGEP